MADDGLLLNFALDDSAAKHITKFKGGSWRDRRTAKRAARHGHQKRGLQNGATEQTQSGHLNNASNQNGLQDHGEYPESRPIKRRREDGEFVPAVDAVRSDNISGKNAREPQAKGPRNSKPREVISSLFTSNPIASSVTEKQAEPTDEVPAKPSNAPLVDGIDTFTSLGLSTTLAVHLLAKMELKNPTAIQKASITQLLKEDSDAFIQSETGSGKTLAYLLPLVQRIMSLTENQNPSKVVKNTENALHRDSGLFAIILAPTRELCKQISVVLERVLGCAHFIVAGTVIGGEKKKSEKARLRKGLNVLLATPGRLVDHLENTKVLDVGNVRWLVLDEGDRLVDLGFEEDISKIVKTLDQRQKKSSQKGLPERRTTILCSATMKMNVQRLGEISLKDAVLIKGDSEEAYLSTEDVERKQDSAFLAPAQLKQSYVVVAAKLRLVTLTALLKRTFSRKGSVMKAIVFVSCADSVEFHFKAFTRDQNSPVEGNPAPPAPSNPEKPPIDQSTDHDSIAPSPLLTSPSNPSLTIYKLHGSLPQASRTSILKAFTKSTTPSLLLATDVASRGLDLPNLDLVIEYDPPFSSDDHLHRIGRTARLGRDGRAVIFLLPGSEEGYVEVLKSSYKTPLSSEGAHNPITHTLADDLLRKGFGPTSGLASQDPSQSWQEQATGFQLDLERWVLQSPSHQSLAKRAFQSHVRGYATHVAAERKWFDIKELHLGHLAKSFGLRDAPGGMGIGRGGGKKGSAGERRRGGGHSGGSGGDRAQGHDDDTATATPTAAEEAARKMREKVRNRKMMNGAGADEFNLA